MNLGYWNMALLVLLIAILLAVWALQPVPERPNLEIIPNMRYSPAFDALSANPSFADLRARWPAPEGTIARGEILLHYAATSEDALRAGEELANPILPGDTAALTRGAHLYQVNCAMCHGGTGQGDGPVTKRGVPPPPSLLTGKSTHMKDGQLMHILMYGQGGMTPFATQLSWDDKWRVIAFVRDLQAKSALNTNPLPTTSPSSADPTGGSP